MTMYDRQVRKQRRTQVTELLSKGLTTRQISERVGTTTRTVLRIKKQLENSRAAEAAT